MSAIAVRAAERSSPCMGPSAGNTGGICRPDNKQNRARPAGQGCNSLNDSAAGVDPTAGGSAKSTVGIREPGVALKPSQAPSSGVRGAFGW